MDELRFVRREDQALIVANEADEEFRLVVDDAVLSELRHLSKRERDTSRVRPREIQALIRGGKTRAQVATLTGLDELDIERYEEPVLAERRYILELAQAVPVRTDVNDETDQRFGEVISERLIGLGSDASEWSSWRDEESGWMISLEFISHDVTHRAVWSFAHRKGTLSPLNPDAVTLSKQGDVGDRLIPKLRAVDSSEQSGRFDSGAFDDAQLPLDIDVDGSAEAESDATPVPHDAPAPSVADVNAEYERRREIDHRAINTNDSEPADLSQTADLLDALRKRRGEREQSARTAETTSHPAGSEISAEDSPDPSPASTSQDSSPRSIWSASGVNGSPRGRGSRDTPPAIVSVSEDPSEAEVGSTPSEPEASEPVKSDDSKADTDRGARKGRASIPSWDDILFGTRSDEDPA